MANTVLALSALAIPQTVAGTNVHRALFTDDKCTQYESADDYILNQCFSYDSTESDVAINCDGSSIQFVRYQDGNCTGQGDTATYTTGKCEYWNDNYHAMISCTSSAQLSATAKDTRGQKPARANLVAQTVAGTNVHRALFTDDKCTQYKSADDYILNQCFVYDSTESDVAINCDGNSIQFVRYQDGDCTGRGDTATYTTGKCEYWNDNYHAMISCTSSAQLSATAKDTRGQKPARANLVV